MTRRILFTALVALLTFGIAGPAAAGGGGGGYCPGFASGATIGMQDSCFWGVAHFAPAGTDLTVSNDGQAPHTLTAVNGGFDTGVLQAGESASLEALDPGIYRVFCTLHGNARGEGMAGVLIVGEPEAVEIGAVGKADTAGPAASVPEVDLAPVVAAIEEQTGVLTGVLSERPEGRVSPWLAGAAGALLAGALVGVVSVGRSVARRPASTPSADPSRA